MSKEGRDFLMCAFAAPDMTVESVRGVPDTFEGKTLLVKHRLNFATNSAPNADTYYILAPIPGVAYLTCQVAVGASVTAATTFYPVFYPDYGAMFPTADTAASLFQSFRHVSNSFEIVPTVNQMTWVGAISVWKAPIRATVSGRTSTANPNVLYQINGLEACNATGADMYVGPFINGCYTIACQQEPDFEFSPVVDSMYISDNNFGQIYGALPGFGNLESVIIKVTGQTAAMPLQLRAWSCVEYLPAPNSAFYRFAQASPHHDPLALEYYRKLSQSLPIAVPYYMNDSFWERVKGIIGDLTAYLSKSNGPIGEAARTASLAYNVTNRLLG